MWWRCQFFSSSFEAKSWGRAWVRVFFEGNESECVINATAKAQIIYVSALILHEILAGTCNKKKKKVENFFFFFFFISHSFHSIPHWGDVSFVEKGREWWCFLCYFVWLHLYTYIFFSNMVVALHLTYKDRVQSIQCKRAIDVVDCSFMHPVCWIFYYNSTWKTIQHCLCAARSHVNQ